LQESNDRPLENQNSYRDGTAIDNLEKITEEKLRMATLQDALSRFGKPLNQRGFKLGDDASEFTISLRNFFTEKEFLHGNIHIIEATWKLDTRKNITAWFRKGHQDKPIDVLVCNIGAEF
jgi:hypothetical protein